MDPANILYPYTDTIYIQHIYNIYGCFDVYPVKPPLQQGCDSEVFDPLIGFGVVLDSRQLKVGEKDGDECAVEKSVRW